MHKEVRGDGRDGQSWQMDCQTQNTDADHRRSIDRTISNRHSKNKSKL